ncbi:hypothetical protein LMG33818_001774 [Halomonadaceae bacterium LMG 33818]|uniref:DMT family transporter n=1 Tax=Cernens ardua TaxID=3402176 RepID=UPI003EDC4CCB
MHPKASVSNNPHTHYWVADIALLGVAIAWGASYPIAKTALFFTTALTLIFIRFLLTALLMGALSIKELKKIRCTDVAGTSLLGGILCLIFICETYGVAMTTATNTALIISLCVIITPFLEYALQKTLPPSGVIIGCLLSVIGVWVLTGGIDHFNAGDTLVLIAAVLRAVMVITTKRVLNGRTLSSACVTALQAITVTILIGAVLVASPAKFQLPNSLTFWLCTAFLSLVCTIAAFFVQNFAVRKTSPTRVNLLMGTEPLWGFVCSILLLGEHATLGSVMGALLVLLGCGVAIYTLTIMNKQERVVDESSLL